MWIYLYQYISIILLFIISLLLVGQFRAYIHIENIFAIDCTEAFQIFLH